MNPKHNLIWFLTGVLVTLLLVLLCNLRRTPTPIAKDEELVHQLTTTIEDLKEELADYKKHISDLEQQKDTLKKEVTFIVENYEKIDSNLLGGDTKFNVDYLSRKLSESGNDKR